MTDSKLPGDHPFAEFFREAPADEGPAAASRTAAAQAAAPAPTATQAAAPAPGTRRAARAGQVTGAAAGSSAPSNPASGVSATTTIPGTRPVTGATDAFDSLPPQSPPPAGPPPRVREPQPPRRRRSRRGLWALIIAIVVVAALAIAGWFVYTSYAPQIEKIFGVKTVEDYSGTGTGEQVSFVIASGDTGTSIADNLQKADIIKSSDTFYSLAIKNPSLVFQPGTYTLQKQMSAQSALDALQNPANAVTNTVVITEGTIAADVLTQLADKTGVPLTDLQTEAANYTQFGIDASAPNIEGYLFPATYTFQPNTSAHDLLKTMVDRAFQSLDAAGVAPADREKVLTMASIIQKEGGSTDDFYKVSRVFANRIADGMPLQSDATVAYGTGSKEVDTTDAQRNDESNKYNTYVIQGLPIGPISNPGDDAIKAALNPADGTWLYFVTVNLDTGLTCFSDNLDEHNAAVQLYQAGNATSCP
ncbi:endolytic transglycosylase MltG [Subtercola endophyticus]|uniref:endolytic transglycosylase MltG n=1 Tax=Subtercola endophyticus TaxID=2895559 RepID=UPI001E31C902|nr:endolytic transglycosylase MltG [Subtercola endophyticus]UFS60282.1 endolytic transglycosylase MltG [Subtercola endophyticus]